MGVIELKSNSIQSDDLPPRAWDVLACGDYAEDCAVGREKGIEFVQFALAHPDIAAIMLAGIVREMVARGPAAFGGVEIGFLTELVEGISLA